MKTQCPSYTQGYVGDIAGKKLSVKPMWPNKKTNIPEKRKVILDCTYMNDLDHAALWNWLKSNLNEEEIGRIIEVNVKL